MPDIVGWTPLHVACHYKRDDVILLLLKHGANLNNKNRDGLYAIDLICNDLKCRHVINNFIIHSYSSSSNLLNNNSQVNQGDNSSSLRNSKSRVDCNREVNKTNKELSDTYHPSKSVLTKENYITNELVTEKFLVNTDLSNQENELVKPRVDKENQDKSVTEKIHYNETKLASNETCKSFYNTHNFVKKHFNKNKIDVRSKQDCNYSFISANSENVRLNTIEEIQNEDKNLKSKQILDLYKVIPKKHKFYETFKNGLDKKKNLTDILDTCTNFNNNQMDPNKETFNNSNDRANTQYLHLTLPSKGKSRSELCIAKKSKQNINLVPNDNINKTNLIGIDEHTPANTISTSNYLARSTISGENRNILNNFLIEIPKAFPVTNNFNKINIKTNNIGNPSDELEKSETKPKSMSNSFEDKNSKNNNETLKSKDFLFDYYTKKDNDNLPNLSRNQSKFLSFVRKNYTGNYRKHLPNCSVDSDSEMYQKYDSLLPHSDDSFEINQSVQSKDNQTMNIYKSRKRSIIHKRNLNAGKNLKKKKKLIERLHNNDPLIRDKSQEIFFFSSSDEKDLIDLDNLANINDITPVKDHTITCLEHPLEKLTSKEVNETDIGGSFLLSEEIAIAMKNSTNNCRNPLVKSESVHEISKDSNISDAFILHTRDKNTKKIIYNLESENFFSKVNLAEIFFDIFEIEKKEMEIVMSYLFFIDPKFALSLFINVYRLENKYENFANIITNEISDKFLQGLILNSNYENEEINRNFLIRFFDSFEYDETNFLKSLKKCFKSKSNI